MNVRRELKAVLRVLLDTVQTCCQYVELIPETVEMNFGVMEVIEARN